MQTEGSHKAMVFSAIVFTLFGGYFAYAAFTVGQLSAAPFIEPVTASDNDEGKADTQENAKRSESDHPKP